MKRERKPLLKNIFSRKSKTSGSKVKAKDALTLRKESIQENKSLLKFGSNKQTKSYKANSVTQRYSDLAKKRKRDLFKNKLSTIKLNIPFKSMLVAIVLIVIVSVFLILRNSAFNIQEIRLIAPAEVTGQIESITNEYKGRNIYLVNESEISNRIHSSIPEIEKVYLYKQLPDKLLIEAVQGNPALIVASINGVELLNSQAESIGSFSGLPEIQLSPEENKLLLPEKDLTLVTIKTRFLEGKSDQEKLLLDWTKVSDEEKLRIYDILKSEVTSKLSTFFNSVQEVYSQSIYNTLPLIQGYYIEQPSVEDVSQIVTLIDNVASRQIQIVKSELYTKFTLDLTAEDNKIIRLSLRRKIEDQIKDLDSIIYYGLFSSARVIDLRSDTYSITR